MGDKMVEAMVTIGGAIIALAIIATLVSKNANTTGVIQAGASGFNNALAVAEAPVTGAQATPVLSYPTAGYGGVNDFAGLTAFPYG
jgi:PRD1 phage membrane DNA delivery